MLLHLDKKIFQELISVVSTIYKYPQEQVEKDYFVSLFLKELLSKTDLPIVFKGGTSLSKAYGIIKRFSEDIDLAVSFEGIRLGDGKRKKLKYQIIDAAKALSMTVKNLDDIESDRTYNQYEIIYVNQFEAKTKMLPFLLIETILAYKPYPCEEKEVSNYIYEYLLENKRIDLIEQYELKPFKAIVQTIERTLIDKLFALCDYHLQKKYNRYSRHLYDIHKIWTSNQLNKDGMITLIEPVVKDRQLAGTQNLSCLPTQNPRGILNQIIEDRVYENDYNDVTSEFIMDATSYETCIKSLREIMNTELIPEYITDFRHL
jgi:hypothetical protein